MNIRKIWSASGTLSDQGFPGAISAGINTQRDMSEFSGSTDTGLANLAAYINAIRYDKPIAQPMLGDEECLFNWAEIQLPTVFEAPAVQHGTVSTLNECEPV